MDEVRDCSNDLSTIAKSVAIASYGTYKLRRFRLIIVKIENIKLEIGWEETLGSVLFYCRPF